MTDYFRLSSELALRGMDGLRCRIAGGGAGFTCRDSVPAASRRVVPRATFRKRIGSADCPLPHEPALPS